MANGALEGIRVVEFGPYVALPLSGRLLAALGAEVIKVETNKVLDEMNFIPAWSRGAGQPEFQSGKKRISLDVRSDKGRELLLKLAAVSDVFMTNFRRNVLARWGIDFPNVQAVRPDIVIMWQTGLGGHGPYYTYKSYGMLVQHIAGISSITGQPGSPPGVVNTSYSDYHTGVLQPMAVIGALIRRRSTGRGATMESSIFKSGAVTAGPAILDYQASQGRQPGKLGNRAADAAPHGVYPCLGEDRYCAIAVFTEEEWDAFKSVLGDPEWVRRPEYATILGRLHNADELDTLIASWTRERAADTVMELMQGAGIAASIVSQGKDIYESAHLKERGFYRETPYYVAERDKIAEQWREESTLAWTSPMRLSETPTQFGHYSYVGEDNPYIFGELLGMSNKEIESLREQQVLL